MLAGTYVFTARVERARGARGGAIEHARSDDVPCGTARGVSRRGRRGFTTRDAFLSIVARVAKYVFDIKHKNHGRKRTDKVRAS